MIAVPSRAADAPPAGFPLAAAAASAHPSSEPRVVRWRFPALPAAVADAASAAWGVTVVADDTAPDPRDGRAFSVLLAHARSEQVVRALATRTNLVLPAAAALVVGDGPIAETIAATLSAGGTRIIRVIDAPAARLRAHLAGTRTATASAPLPAADLSIVTGEGHAPVDPAARSGVAIDASLDGTGLIRASGETVRPFVQHIAPHSWVVAPPEPFTTADGEPGRIADLFVALSILHAHAADADAGLAELVLS
ncbi:hypothetical protein [Microbacterium oxydans]|uniref:hypothetical protein n=1 Tax=Microbacterium oxydans TaxID=82380 RepID=UPI0005ED0264|nr:hypothetical protein [Microbacterium oxydans]